MSVRTSDQCEGVRESGLGPPCAPAEPKDKLKNEQGVMECKLDPPRVPGEPTDEWKKKQSVLRDPYYDPAPHDYQLLQFYSELPPGHRCRTHYLRVICLICGRGHCTVGCDFAIACPLDFEFYDKEGVVVCFCGTKVTNGKCPKNCGSTMGRALLPRAIPKTDMFWFEFPKKECNE